MRNASTSRNLSGKKMSEKTNPEMRYITFWGKLRYLLTERINLFWMRPGVSVKFLFDGKWYDALIENPIYECSAGLQVPLNVTDEDFIERFMTSELLKTPSPTHKTTIIPSRVRKK